MPLLKSNPSRRLRLLLSAIAIAVATSGCTLLAGQPWGQAELSLAVELDIDDSRLTDEGWLKTSDDFAIDLTQLDVGVTGLRLLSADGDTPSRGASGEVFDPASPPPGYSLCHNGHCHADDGRLVDYEDIEAELAGGGVTTGPVTVVGQSVLNSPLALWPEADDVELDACTGGCQLDRVSLSSAAVGVTEVTFAGRVVDLRPASTARLPPQGILVEGEVDAAALLEADLDERFDRDQPLGLRLTAVALLAPTLFDRVAFDGLVGADPPTDVAYDLSDALSVQEAIREALAEDSGLLTDVERFEPALGDNELALLPPPVEAAP